MTLLCIICPVTKYVHTINCTYAKKTIIIISYYYELCNAYNDEHSKYMYIIRKKKVLLHC